MSFSETEYFVYEDDPLGVVEICVVLSGVQDPPTAAEVWLDFSSNSGSADGKSSYI